MKTAERISHLNLGIAPARRKRPLRLKQGRECRLPSSWYGTQYLWKFCLIPLGLFFIIASIFAGVLAIWMIEIAVDLCGAKMYESNIGRMNETQGASTMQVRG